MTTKPSHLIAIALTALGLVPATALAHVEVSSTSPRAGQTARTALRAVSVTFSGPIRSGTLRVTGPGRKVVSVGRGARDPRNLSRLLVGLASGLHAGSYTASWTAVAADGHRENGSFRFRLKR